MISSDSKHIAVLLGGRSAEREVSLNSGAKVSAALRSIGHIVTEYDTKDISFIKGLIDNRPDVVFIALHGHYGEDGTVQGLCELLDIPYVGSGVLASALAIDKVMSKLFFAQADFPTPPYLVVHNDSLFDMDECTQRVQNELGTRVVVKPADEGSSIGMSIVHALDELPEAIKLAFKYDSRVLIEQYVDGIEVTVGVLGNEAPKALPTIEVVAENEFYDYDSKYLPGMSKHIIPARVGEATNLRCQELAELAHRALGCRGISRSDFIVDSDGEVWLLETNTLPGMTNTSLVPDAAAAVDLDYEVLCEMLVQFALDGK